MMEVLFGNNQYKTSRRPSISLIVCSRNRQEQLQFFLDHLTTDDLLQARGELVLVDNGSSDSSVRVMKDFAECQHFPVLVVEQGHEGLSRARNTGVSCARAKLLAFTDDDCVIAAGYLQGGVALFADERWAFAGGSILPGNSYVPAYGTCRYENFQEISPGSVVPTGVISGANMILRRKVFDTIGLFDISLGAGTKYRCEDVDYCTRASLAGFTGVLVPDLVVYHHHDRRGKGLRGWRWSNDLARGAYYAKYLRRVPHKCLVLWLRSFASGPNPLRLTRELYGALGYCLQRTRVGYKKVDDGG